LRPLQNPLFIGYYFSSENMLFLALNFLQPIV